MQEENAFRTRKHLNELATELSDMSKDAECREERDLVKDTLKTEKYALTLVNVGTTFFQNVIL